ncbi:YhfX family PLP-dependent enzyme [Vibrio sp. LaRot3]|uniref:YhfX family PLP-dependent enzyme n=1 Tax=Vibrio sp. LaRot3 TaxID=2998829 RepID=UPI0022CE2C59|nr:YhfX family PLP-dependent enzyme [Vibrio sp. LaRot3]MDA0149804.1 YhfX family PLP-dependent enzyme [Vibrio sp. LaRot3]
MFLQALEKQNPALIEATLTLFYAGKLMPDTAVIDVDQLLENAKAMRTVADQYGIKLYAMTKQIGRNPIIAKMLIDECSFDGIVCVDFKEARIMAKHGLPIANVGHLVQPPRHFIPSLVKDIKPEVITVYSLEKAQQISNAADQAGCKQGILLKFYHPRDHLYVNQESGFAIEDIDSIVAQIQQMSGVEIVGITHFPCFLYNQQSQATEPTPNISTLLEANQKLQALGIECTQVNAPSATSIETIPMLAKFGCTHGEPGHALTGTMPANAHYAQNEKVALLYLSEIAHHYGQDSYCFGGGFYRRGMLENALVFEGKQKHQRNVFNDDNDSIDYHFRLPGHFSIGSPVIMAYRTQVFVTRSDVALIRGVKSACPEIIGIYDALGNEVQHG